MEDPKNEEWIERLDNPQLSKSEQFDLSMEADFNMGSDHMMAMQEQEDCRPTWEELKSEIEADEEKRDK